MSNIRLMSLDYRVIHFLAIVSLGAITVTGSSEHGFSLLTFHIDFGLFAEAVLAAYSTILLAQHRVRLFDVVRHPLGAQLREGFAVLQRYLSGRPIPAEVKSRMGRYNVLATYASLALALGFIPLTVGGVEMTLIPPRTLLFEEMKVIHLFGVGIIGLFFLVHFFAVIHPENWPLLRAMFTNGRVPFDWAREHLAGYLGKPGGSRE